MEPFFKDLNEARCIFADMMIKSLNETDSIHNYYGVSNELKYLLELYENPPMSAHLFEESITKRLHTNLENAVWNASYKFKALEDKFNHKAIFKFADEQMLKFNKDTKNV